MTDTWSAAQQRLHNLATFRWAETRQPRKRARNHKFTPEQLAIAIRSIEKKEQANWQS